MCSDIIAITNRKLCKNNSFIESLDAALRDNVKYLIIREKDLPVKEYINLVNEIEYHIEDNYPDIDTKIIMNLGNVENISQMLEIINSTDCKNVHLPVYAIDKLMGFKSLRKKLNILGISIHSIKDIDMTCTYNPDYYIAGHIFVTECKKNLMPRGLEFMRNVCDYTDIPVYGVGGINHSNMHRVAEAGGSGVCMMSEYFN